MLRRMYYTPLKPIELSIISINYNGFADTCEMIESIRKRIKSVVYEIIIVDNASKENEAFQLRKKYPFIQVMRSRENLGFAAGNNLAIKIAKGKYLFFLNNDTYLKGDHFREMIDFLKSSPNIGGLSPLIRYAEKKRPVQFAGFTPLTEYTLRNRSIGIGETFTEKFLIPAETPYMHGAAMLVKRSAIEKVGEMPEQFFLYYEELDWSTRFTENGYKLYYYPYVTIFHKESRTTGKTSPLRTFFMTRNRLVYAYRNRKGKSRLYALLYLLFAVCPRDFIREYRKKNYDNARAIDHGISSFFNYLGTFFMPVDKKTLNTFNYDDKFDYYVR